MFWKISYTRFFFWFLNFCFLGTPTTPVWRAVLGWHWLICLSVWLSVGIWRQSLSQALHVWCTYRWLYRHLFLTAVLPTWFTVSAQWQDINLTFTTFISGTCGSCTLNIASQINQTLARLLIWLWAKVLMYRRRKTFLSNNLFVEKWIYLFNSAGFFEKEVT